MKVLLKKLGLGESYTSLILGIIVVVIVGILLITFIRRQGGQPGQPTLAPVEVEQAQTGAEKGLPKKHTVAQGENLWIISEKYYKSGYNWVDLVKANNLVNPDILMSGVELTIPDIEPKTPAQITQVDSPIQGDSYTVVQDDNLWTVAIRAYGDGFKWVEIAKANNLANPNLIHAGNVLKLPR